MHEIIAEKTLSAPLDRVWALVADFSNLDWYEPAEKVERIASDRDDGIGEIRRIHMPNMPDPIDEVLSAIDHQQHQLSYRIPQTPMANYEVTISLTKVDASNTHAKWHAQFTEVTMDGLTPEMMIGIMQDTYGTMLEHVEKAVAN